MAPTLTHKLVLHHQHIHSFTISTKFSSLPPFFFLSNFFSLHLSSSTIFFFFFFFFFTLFVQAACYRCRWSSLFLHFWVLEASHSSIHRHLLRSSLSSRFSNSPADASFGVSRHALQCRCCVHCNCCTITTFSELNYWRWFWCQPPLCSSLLPFIFCFSLSKVSNTMIPSCCLRCLIISHAAIILLSWMTVNDFTSLCRFLPREISWREVGFQLCRVFEWLHQGECMTVEGNLWRLKN